MVPAELLAPLPLFHDAPAGVVAALAKRGVEVGFASDAVIFLAGSAPRGWYVVVEGKVRVVRGSGSRQHVIHTEGRGGTLGEVPLFTDRPYPATAIAAEPTTCVLFDRRALEGAIAEAPGIAFLIARRLALRVEHLVNRLHERSTSDVRARLSEFLLRRDRAVGRDVITLGMTQQALAEDLGTVREVVVRELRALVRLGAVEALGRGRYRVVASDVLRREAEPGG